MKRLINALLVAVAAAGLFACKTDEPETPAAPSTVFEIDDLEALPAAAGTFSVGITTNVVFTVSIPSDIAWLRYVDTKSAEAEAPASRKAVTFEIDLNEEDAMRQARVSFLDSEGGVLKNLTIIQKAGGGIEFDVAAPDDVPVTGGTVSLAITSNVPFDATPEVDWIEVKAKTASSVELAVASNTGTQAREGTVNFYREGTENLIGFVTLHQMEPNIVMTTPEGTNGYATVAEAMEAYNALAAGPVTMVLAKGNHEGDIVVGAEKPALTVTGNGVATLEGSIEVKSVAVSVKDLSLIPQGGTLPALGGAYNYEFGIMLHSAGFGSRVENVSIDMSKLADNATGIFLLGEDKGTTTDVVRNNIIDGGDKGRRLMQIYSADASLTGNVFQNPYSSYAVRVGTSGNDVLLAGNTFKGPADCGVHFYNLTNSTVTLGNGSKDTNKFDETISAPYKANSDVTAGGNSFAPVVSYADGVVSVYVDPNAPATLERVWGYYNGNLGTWDDEITGCSNWNRNGIISGDYVYVTLAGNEDGKYGVAVFDLYTGAYIRTITNGFTKEGRFWTCGIVKMAGYEDDVIYVSNMAMGDSGQDLVVYRMVEPDSEGVPTKAEEAMRYKVPAGERYGDKMTCWGTDEDGILMFVSFYDNTAEKKYRQEVEFRLTAGVVGSEPDLLSNALAGRGGSVTGGIYILSAQTTGNNATRQALWANNFELRFVVGWWWENADMWYNCRIDESAEWGVDPGSIFTGVGNYDDCCLDPRLVFIGGVRYLVYTVVTLDSDNKASGYLRMVRCPDAEGTSAYGLLNAFWAVRDDASAFQRYPLGDPDDFLAVGHEGTNKTGYCDVAYRGDDIYILSGVTSTGMSLFKVE